MRYNISDNMPNSIPIPPIANDDGIQLIVGQQETHLHPYVTVGKGVMPTTSSKSPSPCPSNAPRSLNNAQFRQGWRGLHNNGADLQHPTQPRDLLLSYCILRSGGATALHAHRTDSTPLSPPESCLWRDRYNISSTGPCPVTSMQCCRQPVNV